jgi:hypothetical protein
MRQVGYLQRLYRHAARSTEHNSTVQLVRHVLKHGTEFDTGDRFNTKPNLILS